MNVQLKDITVTARDGRVSHLDQVYIRGSHVRFFIVPDMLRNDEWEDLCRENGGWEYIDISSENPAAEEPGREREGWQRNEYGGTSAPITRTIRPKDYKSHRKHSTNASHYFLETSGLARVREALEANDWDAVDDIIPFATDDINFQEPNIGEDDESDGSNLDIEVGELESEMTGMRRAIWENRGEESQDGDGIIDKQDGEGVDDEADDMKVVELQNMMLKMQAVKDMGADMPPSERKRFATKAVRDILRTV
ncbi:hypothetical protein MMC06_000298 [Schaereria dolodes]|nr:hypothetical protein [Schaereria dolodes]